MPAPAELGRRLSELDREQARAGTGRPVGDGAAEADLRRSEPTHRPDGDGWADWGAAAARAAQEADEYERAAAELEAEWSELTRELADADAEAEADAEIEAEAHAGTEAETEAVATESTGSPAVEDPPGSVHAPAATVSRSEIEPPPLLDDPAAPELSAATERPAADEPPPTTQQLITEAMALRELGRAMVGADEADGEAAAAGNTSTVLRRALAARQRPRGRVATWAQPALLAVAAGLVGLALVLIVRDASTAGIVVAAVAVGAAGLALVVPTHPTPRRGRSSAMSSPDALQRRLERAEADRRAWEAERGHRAGRVAELAQPLGLTERPGAADLTARRAELERAFEARRRFDEGRRQAAAETPDTVTPRRRGDHDGRGGRGPHHGRQPHRGRDHHRRGHHHRGRRPGRHGRNRSRRPVAQVHAPRPPGAPRAESAARGALGGAGPRLGRMARGAGARSLVDAGPGGRALSSRGGCGGHPGRRRRGCRRAAPGPPGAARPARTVQPGDGPAGPGPLVAQPGGRGDGHPADPPGGSVGERGP